MYSFSASDGSLMAWGALLRRINSNHFYDLDEFGVITFESLKGTMQAKFEIKGRPIFRVAKFRGLIWESLCWLLIRDNFGVQNLIPFTACLWRRIP
jgi:hypothetical protein